MVIALTHDTVSQKFEAENYFLLSRYKNSHTKLDVVCPKQHQYQVTWANFKQGYRCPYCSGRYNNTTESIRARLEKEGYKLLSEYKNVYTKIELECPKGHQFSMTWSNFGSLGQRCPICHKITLSTQTNRDTIALYMEKEGYTLLSIKYINNYTPLRVKCPKGHIFYPTWANYRAKTRCPKCNTRRSRAETEIVELYSKIAVVENDRHAIGPKELDIYFPVHKVAIEYCGLYWHSDKQDRTVPSYHRNKLDLCTKQNIRLLTIFEDEWLNHKDICVSRINNTLGLITNKIYARKCIVKQIDKRQAKEFLNHTHLQGYGSCKIAYGLFYQDQLVQVMTFGSPARAHTAKGKRVLEMKRLASQLNTVVVGGAGKIFKLGLQYAKDNDYDLIKSYCDLRWGTGNLYKKLGFTKTHETRYTPHYTDFVHRYRNQTLATNKKKEGVTESSKAFKRKLYRIYDCGHSTWEYKI